MPAISKRVFGLIVLSTITAVADGGGADAGAASEPVYRCAETGFIEVPGSDICLSISGYTRLDATAIGKNWLGTDSYEVGSNAVDGYSAAQSGVVPTISFGFRDDTLESYSEARLNIDARSATEYGTVRAYIQIEATDDELRTGGQMGLRHAYVQFGNWLFGKTFSTILHQASGPEYSDPYTVVGDNSTNMRRNQIRYTQPLGGGLSLAVAIEDQAYDSPPAAIVGVGPDVPVTNPAATGLSVATASSAMPDVVAALNWTKESVGSWQIAGALHRNVYAESQTIGGLPVTSFNDDRMGFALLFGLALDLPTGDGDVFTLLANYTDGASQYLQDIYADGTTVVWGRCGAVNCILDQVRIWSVVSSVSHALSETWTATAGAGYAQTDYGAVGTALAGTAGTPGILEADSLEIFANVAWRPVAKTTFMLDVHYGHIDFGSFDLDAAQPGIQSDQGAWAVTFEVTRSF